MWPRLFSQFIELLPHLTRLAPVADTLIAVRSNNEQTQTARVAALADALHGDISRQMALSQTEIVQRLDSQAREIAIIRQDLDLALEERIAQTAYLKKLVQDTKAIGLWVKAGICVLVVLMSVLIYEADQFIHSH
jgi:hypothetical protein